jgi:hypothetical protein
MLQRETNNPVFIGALKFFFQKKTFFSGELRLEKISTN